eukprot:TRINITY_DN139_c2_g1_i1.p1 TRINITY_DN139_c2_g1~~TRINITY_DN139_c2_g1_i1.p1  ORF type:complete len:352 (-),score=96.60 TRINITY_DN139_c2_g1_i1:98-1153(-)
MNSTDSTGSEGVDSHAVGLAFGLIAIAAGFAVISALLPLVDRTNLFRFKIATSKLLLSTTLAFSAGVLTFFSLNHILGDAKELLEGSSNDKVVQNASAYTLGVFIVTLFVCVVLQFLAHKFIPRWSHHHHHNRAELEKAEDSDPIRPHNPSDAAPAAAAAVVEIQPAASGDPQGQEQQFSPHKTSVLSIEEKKQLNSGMLGVTIAIALHNIPEGLLLFLTTYESAAIGVGIAFGLMFHKIPEGFVIAMPYYYGTNKALLGLGPVLFAGVVCMFVGGLIGYAIVVNNPGADTSMWGLLLAFTAGILLFISIGSLLPRAQKLDPQDVVRSKAFFAGVSVIALSIIILSVSGGD